VSSTSSSATEPHSVGVGVASRPSPDAWITALQEFGTMSLADVMKTPSRFERGFHAPLHGR
jgi:hypothetical protein